MAQIIDWYADGSVAVLDLSLACCAVESEFAVPEGAPRVDELPEGARVVAVLSGTLTGPLGTLLASRIAALPAERTTVVSFGACACAGGPYWDSHAIIAGADRITGVDHFIPGCPPPPSALADYVDSVRAPGLLGTAPVGVGAGSAGTPAGEAP